MNKSRSQRASTLALVGASAIVIAIIILFVLLYMGTGMQVDKQRSAIDAAALAAATDIGRIVYNSPECGFVSLTGAPPTAGAPSGSDTGTQEMPLGQGTTPDGDGWQDQVTSINELMATARLEYVIGVYMSGQSNSDTFLEQLALRDQQRVLCARDELMQVIRNSIQASGNYGYDCSGAKVKPYDDALGMFQGNQMANSTYVAAPALTITLGCVSGGMTTPIPTPDATAGSSLGGGTLTPASGCNGNYYIGDVDVPYNSQNFMLGSIGNQPTIIDKGKFAPVTMTFTSGSAASYSCPTLSPAPANANLLIPCAVQVEATQNFNLQGKSFNNRFVACAVPGGNFRTQSLAQLTVSFPDGPLPEINCLADTFYKNLGNNATSVAWQSTAGNPLMNANADVYDANGGDYEGSNASAAGSLSPDYTCWGIALPNLTVNAGGTSPLALKCSEMAWLCIHNWLRTEGTLVNIASFMSAQTQTFVNPLAHALFNSDKKTPGNTISWNSQAWFNSPPPASPVPFTVGTIPQGLQEIYAFDANGNVVLTAQTIEPQPYIGIDENQLAAESLQSTPTQGFASTVNPWSCGPIPNGLEEPTSISIGHDHWHETVTGWVPTNGVQFQGTNNIDVWFRSETIQPGNGNTANPDDGGSLAVTVVPSNTYTPDGGAHAGAALCPIVAPMTNTAGGALTTTTNTCAGGCACPSTGICACPSPGGAGVAACSCLSCGCSTSGAGGIASLATQDQGAPPVVSNQDDFASTTLTPPPVYNAYPSNAGSSTVRPSYTQAGLASDIRFRREVNAQKYTYQRGYVGLTE